MAKAEETLKIKNKSLAGRKVLLPIVGEQELDEDGGIEVSEELANQLVGDGKSGWVYVTGDELSEEQQKAAIDKMDLPDLLVFAEEAGFPEAEYEKYKEKKKLMQIYINKKLKEV